MAYEYLAVTDFVGECFVLAFTPTGLRPEQLSFLHYARTACPCCSFRAEQVLYTPVRLTWTPLAVTRASPSPTGQRGGSCN